MLSLAQNRLTVLLAMGLARSACSKVFFPCNRRAPVVTVLESKLKTLVRTAVARVCGRNKTLSVKVPAGVDTGDRIRLTGEGQAGARGGPSGDLYVEMHVQPHQIFQRDGRDLPVNTYQLTDAAIGGEPEVPTLDGRVKLRPAETQTGKRGSHPYEGVRQICFVGWCWKRLLI